MDPSPAVDMSTGGAGGYELLHDFLCNFVVASAVREQCRWKYSCTALQHVSLIVGSLSLPAELGLSVPF